MPLSRETIQAFQRVMKKRPKAKPFVIDGRGNFLFVNHKGKPKVAIDYNMLFVRMVKKYNKHHKDNPLPHITPHTLRHTFCTRLASKNMNPKDLQYIHNYITNEVTELEELMEIKQLIQRQKIERMMKVHKEMRGVDRYREQPKEYKYHDPYDDWIFRQLADIDNRNNIPDTSPQLDFNETDYQDYLKEKWNRGL